MVNSSIYRLKRGLKTFTWSSEAVPILVHQTFQFSVSCNLIFYTQCKFSPLNGNTYLVQGSDSSECQRSSLRPKIARASQMTWSLHISESSSHNQNVIDVATSKYYIGLLGTIRNTAPTNVNCILVPHLDWSQFSISSENCTKDIFLRLLPTGLNI